MKKISNFLLREMPSYIKKIQEDFERLNSSLDTTKSAIEEQLPSFIGNYTKIGEYYSMAQELNEIKKQIHEIQELFSIGKPSIEEISSNELSTDIEHIVDDDQGEYENDMLKENERINYGDYRIDNTVPYRLSEDFTYKRPAAFEFDGVQYPVRDWKQMLLIFCEIMYNKNHSFFHETVMGKDMQGKSRAYFSDEKNVYKPMADGRKIPGSNIYVETNHSANTIYSIINALLIKYNIPVKELKIYLKADYTPLHQTKLKAEKKKIDANIQASSTTDLKLDVKNNPDDFRFAKEPYIKKSDPLMEGLSQRMGTPSHIEYLHMEENDMRRHKSRCIEYDKKKDICMCTRSANFLLKCGGSSHCEYYKEENQQIFANNNTSSIKTVVKSKYKVKVIDKNMIKQCSVCKCATKREMLIVTYHHKDDYKKNQLSTYRCDRCNISYIADTLFKTYTKNKNIDDIDVEFIQ